MRDEGGLKPVSWHDIVPALGRRLAAVPPEAVRFLLSAHASHEELFLVGRLAAGVAGTGGPEAVTVAWRVTHKPQPEHTTFKIPTVDAPNVNGARAFGFVPGEVGAPQEHADVTELRAAIEAGRVGALYVFAPGQAGTLGEIDWIVQARAAGRLPLLVVHGVQKDALAEAADFVLPGSAWAEKDACYTNEQGLLQATTRALPPPGEAIEDWRILVNLGRTLGLPFDYASDTQVRADIAAVHGDARGLAGIAGLAFPGTVSGQTWLQASNPSERWKWDLMYQDLPPLKGTVDPVALPKAPQAIALREVRELKETTPRDMT
jgi:predicted molibdopterin-dependent oxidoreductase YjgC